MYRSRSVFCQNGCRRDVLVFSISFNHALKGNVPKRFKSVAIDGNKFRSGIEFYNGAVHGLNRGV